MATGFQSGEVSVVDGVADELLERILSGELPPGARLPAERELAARLGVSRVSVRSATRRLAEWGVVAARQGSGTRVLPARSWNAGAVPGVLRHALATGDWDTLVRLVADAMHLRRELVLALVARAAPRLGPGSLDGSRRLVEQAWAARGDAAAFEALDVQLFGSYLDAAGMHTSLWLTNTLSEVYVAFLVAFEGASPVPDDFREANLAIIDTLESGDGAAARRDMETLLDRVDARMIAALPEEVRRALEPEE